MVNRFIRLDSIFKDFLRMLLPLISVSRVLYGNCGIWILSPYTNSLVGRFSNVVYSRI